MSTIPADYSNHLATQGLSRGSIRNYLADLSRFTRWFEVTTGESFAPEKLKSFHIDQYREYLTHEQIPASTARRYIASL